MEEIEKELQSEITKRIKESMGNMRNIDLVRLTGLREERVSRLFNGLKRYTLKDIILISSALGESLDYLIKGESEVKCTPEVKKALKTIESYIKNSAKA